MASRRNFAFLLLAILAVGAAVLVNLYADDEAQKIIATAPAEVKDVPGEIDHAACERAQIEYSTLWDASLENPDDLSYEEKLEIALSEVNMACVAE